MKWSAQKVKDWICSNIKDPKSAIAIVSKIFAKKVLSVLWQFIMFVYDIYHMAYLNKASQVSYLTFNDITSQKKLTIQRKISAVSVPKKQYLNEWSY